MSRRLTGLALRLWPRVEDAVGYGLAPIAWLARRGTFVRTIHDGERSLADADRIAVFVHHDRRGAVHDYVLFYLDALREAGFDIVFVSNGPRLTGRSLERLRPRCVAVLGRLNVGYDFGAYRDGLKYLGDLSRFRQVLLANDSVYGPLFDLPTTLARCDARADMWSMTDSWSGRYHLQSYFLLFHPKALASPRFTRFWEPLPLLRSKRWVIRNQEIGLTQAMLREGLSCAALFPYRTAARDLTRSSVAGHLKDEALNPRMREFFAMLLQGVERGTPFNALHHFWDHMIGQLQCPFIKRELVSRNPAQIPHAHLWERLIQSVSTYDTQLIARHLEVAARNRAP